MNFRWIDSIFRMSHKRYGFHRGLQYSKVGLTKAVKALNSNLLSLDLKHLRISADLERAAPHILSMCAEKDRIELIKIS